MPDTGQTGFKRISADGCSLVALALFVALALGGCNHPTAASSAPEASSQPESVKQANELGSSETTVAPPADTSTDGSQSSADSAEVTRESTSEPAATQPKAVNRPPRADRAPTKPGDAEKITFDDLNLQMLANIVFRPFMVTDRVKELEGKRISISGYMHGGAPGSSRIKKFVLLKNTECKFGKDGQADHLAMIYLKNGTAAEYTRSDVKVEGTLRIEPFTGEDGNTWSIYNLEDAQIR